MRDALFMSGNTTASTIKGLVHMCELLFREYILKDYTWCRLCRRDQTAQTGSYWEEFSMLYVVKSACGSWEEVRLSLLIEVGGVGASWLTLRGRRPQWRESLCRQRRWGTGINIRPEAVTGTQASALIATLQRMRLNLAILQPTERVR